MTRTDCRGFTLLEVIVAMGIFLIVIAIANIAFLRIVSSSSQQVRAASSNIEGIVGLELLRYDVEHAGFGLPWAFENYTGTIVFKNLGGYANREVDVSSGALVDGVDSTSYNAVKSTNIKAFSAGTSTKEVDGTAATNAKGGPDYLVLRSTLAALPRSDNDVTRKWAYLNYSASTTSNLSYIKRWNSAEDFAASDRIVTMLSTFTKGKEDKVLLMDGENFEVSLPGNLALPNGNSFKPADHSEIVVAYGVANGNGLRMPYNRTDYYVARAAQMPPRCNPGTGVLYKAVASHLSGQFETPSPLFDCVGDLQVEFEYDANDDGNIVYLDAASLNALSAADLRAHLKNVRIYILAHEGKPDRSFSYPGSGVQVGDARRPTTSGRTLSGTEMAILFGSDWRNYRWKVYTIVTLPKNLVQ